MVNTPGMVADEPEVTTEADPVASDGSEDAGRGWRDLTTLLLLRAAHPRQAVATAIGVAVVAALAGRPSREVLLVLGTVLVGQSMLGWFNDLVDRERDARHAIPGKPVADGRLDPSTVWFSIAVTAFVLVPLAIGNGVEAGLAYLASLVVAVVGTWGPIRRGVWSWLPWAGSFALLPGFVSYGGWGGQDVGTPPEVSVTVLAALLGIGVHVLRSIWGLVPDHEDGWRTLPLRLGLRLGASRLLWGTLAYLAAVVLALALVAGSVGLGQ
jgi:4-hydroxybenzoate polyprenyltransferase